MSEYRFRKGDVGKCRGGNAFEVVAEYTTGLNVALRTERVAVLLTHSDGNQSMHTMLPTGRWREGAEHHHDLLPPTEKRWIVRTESTLLDRNGYKAISYEYDNEAIAKHEYNEFLRFHTSFKNTTLTEVEVPLTRR